VRQIFVTFLSPPPAVRTVFCKRFHFSPGLFFLFEGRKQFSLFAVYLTVTPAGCVCSPSVVRFLFSWCVELFLDLVTRGFCEKQGSYRYFVRLKCLYVCVSIRVIGLGKHPVDVSTYKPPVFPYVRVMIHVTTLYI
jgi:hypothetical protein